MNWYIYYMKPIHQHLKPPKQFIDEPLRRLSTARAWVYVQRMRCTLEPRERLSTSMYLWVQFPPCWRSGWLINTARNISLPLDATLSVTLKTPHSRSRCGHSSFLVQPSLLLHNIFTANIIRKDDSKSSFLFLLPLLRCHSYAFRNETYDISSLGVTPGPRSRSQLNIIEKEVVQHNIVLCCLNFENIHTINTVKSWFYFQLTINLLQPMEWSVKLFKV